MVVGPPFRSMLLRRIKAVEAGPHRRSTVATCRMQLTRQLSRPVNGLPSFQPARGHPPTAGQACPTTDKGPSR